MNASELDELDSLRRLVSILPDNQDKATVLHTLAKSYHSQKNRDSTVAYCERLVTLSESINYPLGVADAKYLLSLVYFRDYELNDALLHIRQHLELIRPEQDTNYMEKGYYTLGLILAKLGQTDSSLHYYRKTYEITLITGNKLRALAVTNAIGNIHQNLSEYDSAAYYYLLSSRICEENDLEQYLGQIYNNLGKTLTKLNQLGEAEKYLFMSLDINRKINNLTEAGLNLSNLGSLHVLKGELEKALEFYSQALDIYKEHGNPRDLADIYNNSGKTYMLQGKTLDALDNYTKALIIYRQNDYVEGMTVAWMNLGEAYTGLGKYGQAKAALDSSLALAKAAGHNNNRCNIYLALALNYHRSGDHAKAYEYQVKFTELHDTIFSLEKTKLINVLKLQYEREKDQTQILELENKNLSMELDLRKKTSQRNATLSTGVSILALAVFLLLYFRQRARKDKIIAEQKIIQLEEEKKLMAARLIVEGQEEERKRIATELHDGLGVLLSATKMQFTSIRDKSPENKELIDRATQLLEQASGDVRKISHNMMPGSLTKLGLYEAAEDLIETINDTEDISAQFEHTGDEERLPENKEIMLYRIIQELVNNTLKHAQARNINLKLEKTDSQFKITYSDDGKGFDVKERLESEISTMGLKSIHSRVNFLNGKLTIDSAPGKGTRYHIEISV